MPEDKISQQDFNALRKDVDKLAVKVEQLEADLASLKQAKKMEPKPAVINVTTTDVPAGEKIWWKKLGGGSLRLGNGKIIKPNETFRATVEELPKLAVKSKRVVPVSGKLPEKKEDPVKSATGYALKEKGVGWFDIINMQTEKPFNEKSLRKTEAAKLLAELS
ncbi:MAG: hypothetical protein ACYSSI_08825 [Planctomycetota bacterium]|jgi:predicted RNase H-like nuclease (RuvC/YqgF family)